MAEATTLASLLARGDAAAPALLAPDRPTLDFAGLRAQVATSGRRLAGFGIGAQDVVAMLLPNGPEAASAFLAVASAATAAPLNPAYRFDEIKFYLEDLRAAALLLAEGDNGPGRAAAAALGLPVIELRAGEAAGQFELIGESRPGAAPLPPGAPQPEDVALLLHTSGTTSRPKLVPLSHRNLHASADNIGRALALTPADRCLNIMPLFHIHGLIGVTIAALAAGGSVYYTPGFNALKFFGWLDRAGASWYSAVPTMHQAILARASQNREIVQRRRLRFIRSSSSSLPPQVMMELEACFGAPVIESYGMTESCHQMTSNPLPPAERRAGSVGIAAGPDLAIFDEAGRSLPTGQEGEVVVRGPSVMEGYLRNEAANRSAFAQGWFRTGDQGRLDGRGYLTITGRIKEIVNRGGEKISPREVDEALMDHPAVLQAVAFAVPHDKLGEDIAAAVVLREGQAADEAAIKDFVRHRLADFKVPRRILILPEIPKGPTGKLQRIGLAKILGLG